MLEKWNELPSLARWILFVPVTVLLTLIGTTIFSFTAMRIASPESFLGHIFILLGSVVSTTIFMWGSVNLPPSGKKVCGWTMFVILAGYIGFSTLMLLNGKNIFGGPISTPVGIFWGVQNLVWLLSGFLAVFYLSREIEEENSMSLNDN